MVTQGESFRMTREDAFKLTREDVLRELELLPVWTLRAFASYANRRIDTSRFD